VRYDVLSTKNQKLQDHHKQSSRRGEDLRQLNTYRKAPLQVLMIYNVKKKPTISLKKLNVYTNPRIQEVHNSKRAANHVAILAVEQKECLPPQ
jgi:hypothetical protein